MRSRRGTAGDGGGGGLMGQEQGRAGGRGLRRRVWSPSAAVLGVAAVSGGVGFAQAFCPAPAGSVRRPGPPMALCGASAGARGALAPAPGAPRLVAALALRMQEQEGDLAQDSKLRGGPGVGARRLGSNSRTLERTRQWFESSTLMGELTTDDGIPVSELALEGRRTDWVDELLTLFNSRVLSRIVNRMAFTIAWAIAVTTIIAIGEVSCLGLLGRGVRVLARQHPNAQPSRDGSHVSERPLHVPRTVRCPAELSRRGVVRKI